MYNIPVVGNIIVTHIPLWIRRDDNIIMQSPDFYNARIPLAMSCPVRSVFELVQILRLCSNWEKFSTNRSAFHVVGRKK